MYRTAVFYRQIESELVSFGSHLWRLDVHSLHSLATLQEAEDILLLAIPHNLWDAEQLNIRQLPNVPHVVDRRVGGRQVRRVRIER